MMDFRCPECGTEQVRLKRPFPTVDIIIECQTEKGERGIVLVKRKNPPLKWALPGGFVDYGESLEEAATREAKEETSLEIKLLGQFHSYSTPERDPRLHAITTVFLGRAEGYPGAADDAAEVALFNEGNLPPLAFDHWQILQDYFRYCSGENPWVTP